MGNSGTEVAINSQPQRGEDNSPTMEEVNTHAQSEDQPLHTRSKIIPSQPCEEGKYDRLTIPTNR